MGKLSVIVWKEVMDLLRDPKFIVGILIPILIFPVMGAIFTEGFKGARAKPCIALTDKDGSRVSRLYAEILGRYAEVACEKPDARVVLEPGFGEQVEKGVFNVTVYYVLSSTSIAASEKVSLVRGALTEAAKELFQEVVGLKQRIALKSYTVYKGRVLPLPPTAFYGIVFGLSNTLIWAVFMVAIMVFQLVAVSIVSEKEYKTLEILLTQPIRNTTVLAGKLIASILIAVIEGAAVLAGMAFYMGSVMSSAGRGSRGFNVTGDVLAILQKAGLMPTPLSIALYVGLIIASLIFILSIGVVVGALASDTKSAGSLSGIFVPIILIPAFAAMFTDIEALPLLQRAALLLIPFTPIFAAGKYLVTNNVVMLAYGLAYTLAWGIGLMALAARIYTSESLLTFRPERLYKLFRGRFSH